MVTVQDVGKTRLTLRLKMSNRPWGFYTCWMLWCLDIKSLWMTETSILEVSGASCSNFAFWCLQCWRDCLFISQHCWDLWKKCFISLGDWLKSARVWMNRRKFIFCKVLLEWSSLQSFPSATAISCPFSWPPAGASVWSLASVLIQTSTPAHVSSCQIAREKGMTIAVQPSWTCEHLSVELQSPLYPWAGRDNQCRVFE